MRFEAKGWYEAERGLDARGGPDAWRGNRRPGPGAIGLRDPGERVVSGGFVLPTFPENWADLPFKLTASETVSYNTNILPFRSASPREGGVLGDFTSTTILASQPKPTVWPTAFLRHDFRSYALSSSDPIQLECILLSAGVNWTLTSRCSGTLGVGSPSPPPQITEQVGTGVNYATTTSLNETGKCAISNGYSVLFNSGLTTSPTRTRWTQSTTLEPK